MNYTLKNGQVVEIDMYEDENFEKYIAIKLFGGSTVVEYNCKNQNNLNEIIEEIESEYNRLLEDDLAFEQSAICD